MDPNADYKVGKSQDQAQFRESTIRGLGKMKKSRYTKNNNTIKIRLINNTECIPEKVLLLNSLSIFVWSESVFLLLF